MNNAPLAIAIPTYNRSEILEENILLMFNDIKELSIPIYISDDSIDDKTKALVDRLKTTYSNIFYSKNTPSLGHDKNCIKTLSLPKEKYVWYLNDSFIIKKGALQKIVAVINGNPSLNLISVNAENRKLALKSKIFDDPNELLKNLGWHLTMTGTTIYSKNSLNKIKELDLKKCKNFPQTLLIFEIMSRPNSKLFWINEKTVSNNKKKKSYWQNNVFDVFLNDWSNLILNLPDNYSSKNKKNAIREHSTKSGAFSFFSFINYRIAGVFNFKIFVKYFYHFWSNNKKIFFLLPVLSLTPKFLLVFLKKTVK